MRVKPLILISTKPSFTILPKFTVESSEYFDKLKIINLDTPTYENIYVLYKEYKDLPIRYSWFLDHSKSFLKEWIYSKICEILNLLQNFNKIYKLS